MPAYWTRPISALWIRARQERHTAGTLLDVEFLLCLFPSVFCSYARFATNDPREADRSLDLDKGKQAVPVRGLRSHLDSWHRD